MLIFHVIRETKNSFGWHVVFDVSIFFHHMVAARVVLIKQDVKKFTYALIYSAWNGSPCTLAHILLAILPYYM